MPIVYLENTTAVQNTVTNLSDHTKYRGSLCRKDIDYALSLLSYHHGALHSNCGIEKSSRYCKWYGTSRSICMCFCLSVRKSPFYSFARLHTCLCSPTDTSECTPFSYTMCTRVSGLSVCSRMVGSITASILTWVRPAAYIRKVKDLKHISYRPESHIRTRSPLGKWGQSRGMHKDAVSCTVNFISPRCDIYFAFSREHIGYT